MLPERLAHLKQFIKRPEPRQSELVYVMWCHGFVKIGVAVNVVKRVSELQVGNPFEITLLGFWKSQNAVQEEETIHACLNQYRVRGEWFKLPKSIMDNISLKQSGESLAAYLTSLTL